MRAPNRFVSLRLSMLSKRIRPIPSGARAIRSRKARLTVEEAHALLETIPITKKPGNDPEAADQPDLLGLRDRALIAIMVYSFARIGAVIQMKVGDYFIQGRRRWVRLHEKGGKEHDVPCHHRFDQCLHDYIEAAGIADDVDGYLFRSARRKTGHLTTNPLFQQDAHPSSAGARKQPVSKRGLAIIPSVRPGLRPI
jgi:integrase